MNVRTPRANGVKIRVMSSSDPTTILIVDDEESIADLYSEWLQNKYTVRTAYGGQSALDQLDDTVDIVLLDRRMPDLTGDEVLERARARGLDLQIAMVTAVDPDFDVIEMGFDDYIVKPVSKSDLFDLVDRLLDVGSYDDVIQRYFQLASKKAVLEASKSAAELEASSEYQQLLEEFNQVQRQADQMAVENADRAFQE